MLLIIMDRAEDLVIADSTGSVGCRRCELACTGFNEGKAASTMASNGGWAGKVLRVDLSTGRIWTEDTIEKYKDYLGGAGIGYKVVWDEVPAGTKAFDPGNKIILAVGPLAGTGAPSSSRTAITTLWPTCWPKPLVASGQSSTVAPNATPTPISRETACPWKCRSAWLPKSGDRRMRSMRWMPRLP